LIDHVAEQGGSVASYMTGAASPMTLVERSVWAAYYKITAQENKSKSPF
jgi:hypothetical protein